MRVNHRRFEISMAQQKLDRTNVGSIRKQVCGKRMAKRMHGDVLDDSGPCNRFLEGLLQRSL